METRGTMTINGHEYVDLGLSVKWARYNVGASKPKEYGYYLYGASCARTGYEGVFWSSTPDE